MQDLCHIVARGGRETMGDGASGSPGLPAAAAADEIAAALYINNDNFV